MGLLDEIFDEINSDLKSNITLKTYVTIILDSSGSMASMKKEALEMFNEQIDSLNESKGNMKTFISCVTFGTKVNEPLLWCEDIEHAVKLTDETYNPKGGTALLDAVGYTVDKLKELPDYKDENTSFLLIIITDGEENSSVKYNYNNISSILNEVQETKRWTVTYLGTKDDLSIVRDVFNIPEGNIKAFVNNVDFTKELKKYTTSTAYYMSERLKGVKNIANYHCDDKTVS